MMAALISVKLLMRRLANRNADCATKSAAAQQGPHRDVGVEDNAPPHRDQCAARRLFETRTRRVPDFGRALHKFKLGQESQGAQFQQQPGLAQRRSRHVSSDRQLRRPAAEYGGFRRHSGDDEPVRAAYLARRAPVNRTYNGQQLPGRLGSQDPVTECQPARESVSPDDDRDHIGDGPDFVHTLRYTALTRQYRRFPRDRPRCGTLRQIPRRLALERRLYAGNRHGSFHHRDARGA